MTNNLSTLFCFAIFVLQCLCCLGQDRESRQLHETLEREHGIRMIPIAGGELPSIDTDFEEAKKTFGVPRRRLTRILMEESKFREECPAIESFYLGATEISRRQMESVYRSLLGFDVNDPLQRSPFAPPQNSNLNEPAENFCFADAAVLCNALSKLYKLPEYYRLTLTIKPEEDVFHIGVGAWRGIPFLIEVPDSDGNGFRLPTAWEWEYACRAGANTWYFFGDDPSEMCEYGCIRECQDELGRQYKRPIACASFKANALGLYDMHGSVWEWCMGRVDGNRLRNVQYLKGGSVDSSPFESRCSYLRNETSNNSGIEGVGFGLRVARND